MNVLSPGAPSRIEAAEHGFSPGNTGVANAAALQRAVDRGGVVTVSRPGTYDIAGTVYLGSDTCLEFAPGVFLRKVAEPETFTHLFLNKGALTKTWDHDITVRGLHLIVNGVDVRRFLVYGLRGQIGFFYVRNLRIEDFRCDDLGADQYAIHVCTFENLLVERAVVRGNKDGVHLGRGRGFVIRGCRFSTFDDAVALNAHDYATGNPELGWIEDGLVEDCIDMATTARTGFFCRILAGGWGEWRPGMEVQQSDSVVSGGRIYRVQAQPDGARYTSLTRPAHTEGRMVIDGINWGVVQDDPVLSAGVRRVTFRNIVLRQPRPGFSIHFDNDRYSRSLYPGTEAPKLEELLFENVTVEHDQPTPLLMSSSPVPQVLFERTTFGRGGIRFLDNGSLVRHPPTTITLKACSFPRAECVLVTNEVRGKRIELSASESRLGENLYDIRIEPGPGEVEVTSDLPALGA